MGIVDKFAKIIWDYHQMQQKPEKADCIFVLCSLDTRVAERATELYKQGFAPYILFSGGFGALTKDLFEKPEAEVFADIALEAGVPSEFIITESTSTNTGENILFSKKLLGELNYNFNKFILVQKPYMERRTYATFKKQWPEKDFIVTSPKLSYEEYMDNPAFKEKTLHIMVGDLQRLIEYPTRGFQIPQEIPSDVLDAYQQLVDLGYTKHLIHE